MEASSLSARSINLITCRLEGKVAIITGGASGLGRATAKIFARYGAKVIAADVQDDLGHSLVDEAVTSNQTISFIHCDVTKDDDVKNLVDTVISEHGKLDIMFSNAGILGNLSPSILTADAEDLSNIFGVNVFGAFFCAKHAARVMIPAKRGSIIFTASCVSKVAGLASHTYTSTKHAVVGLTKNLCVELGQHGIRVNCISPHAVPTTMYNSAIPLEKDIAARLVMDTAVLKGVTLEANDVGEMAVFLGSDESKYVSGVNLLIDGGYTTTNSSLGDALAKALIHSP
ncbi:secoisolariciresinol dehydrogenase-like [Impatiens glandulifera]|uniref:secoisolariciresinol dehydrogenase-like n=1 Tax=Impatiens glandulifera TaxID=253017 RepID=UPI001FB17F82|nr:secoisolariciresinol dehydrogenase-like [Impatiens glandulifera]XP_047332371.1 secoisolariciresinol dehydrogenase-like [Impatiens glandulifera]